MLQKKITSTITFEANWLLKNFFLTIQMCQVSSCVLEDYLVWGIPVFYLVSYASVEKLEFL